MKLLSICILMLLSVNIFAFEGQPRVGKVITAEGEIIDFKLTNLNLFKLYITNCTSFPGSGEADAIYLPDPSNETYLNYNGVDLKLIQVTSSFLRGSCDFRFIGTHIFMFKRGSFEIEIEMHLNPHWTNFKVEEFDVHYNDSTALGISNEYW